MYARTKSRCNVMMIAVSQVFGRFDRCEMDGPVETERFRLFFSMVTTGHQHDCRQLQLLQVATYKQRHRRTVPIFLRRRRSAVVGTRRRQHGNKIYLNVRQSANVYNFLFFSCFEFSRGISHLDTVHRRYTYAICYCVH